MFIIKLKNKYLLGICIVFICATMSLSSTQAWTPPPPKDVYSHHYYFVNGGGYRLDLDHLHIMDYDCMILTGHYYWWLLHEILKVYFYFEDPGVDYNENKLTIRFSYVSDDTMQIYVRFTDGTGKNFYESPTGWNNYRTVQYDLGYKEVDYVRFYEDNPYWVFDGIQIKLDYMCVSYRYDLQGR